MNTGILRSSQGYMSVVKIAVVGEVVEVVTRISPEDLKPRGHQTKYITSTATYNDAKLCTQEFPLCHCFTLTPFMISASCITFTIFYQHTTCKRNGMENNIPTHLKWVYFCSWRPNALVDLTTQRFQMGSDISDMDQDHWPCCPMWTSRTTKHKLTVPYRLSINDRYWLWYPDTSSKNSHDDNFIKFFCQLLFLDDMKQSTWTPPAATFPPMATVANQQHEAQDVFHHWTKLARYWKAFHYVLQETVSNCLSGTSFVRLAQGWKTLRPYLAVSV